ncbi:uncharacterized protein LOC106638942 [Copidosoma floridanum]|uniref:uncharacterized protein LOC106638942 n=1 Tax=Copidosoma floridanum TaxID=29053 RepID=UPI0006C96BA7|nr:uncharacterized protein LOC106638942 [Copidosoma floridanum]
MKFMIQRVTIMKFLVSLLFLLTMVFCVWSASVPRTVESNSIKSAYVSDFGLSDRLKRSPKHGELVIQIEKEVGQQSSIVIEGKQILLEGKYGSFDGKVEVTGSVVKTPNEETKGKVGLGAKFEWDK